MVQGQSLVVALIFLFVLAVPEVSIVLDLFSEHHPTQ